MPSPSGLPFHENPVPASAGAGFKGEHATAILSEEPVLGFFEVHAENYMGDGGVPHRQLGQIRERYALSVHGVGLSIGGADRPDRDHLQRLRRVIDRYQPGLFSEHLAWSTHDGHYLSDLLPVPYNAETLARVCDHVDEVQEVTGRQMLLENPSTYVAFEQSTMSEIDFITQIAGRTGCGLLLDVNNVFVSATNHGYSPEAYLDAFPVARVGEVHLAGHAPDEDEQGRPLLIDSHDRAVADPVWDLYRRLIARTGPIPTLIEWDSELPGWDVLKHEALEAERIMFGAPRHADVLQVAHG